MKFRFTRKSIAVAMSLALTAGTFTSCDKNDDPIIEPEPEVPALVEGEVKSGQAGFFTAEGKTVDTRFVRVLYAAEGSEKEGESNSVEQIVYDSKDQKGNAVKTLRFQIVAKNTGYDKLETDENGDFKLKGVNEGAKLFIEVPVAADGKLQLEKAFVGNLGYTFGGTGERNQLEADDVSDIEFRLTKLDLPNFDASNKPGDKGIKYEQGHIAFEFVSKAKYLNSDQMGDFNIKVDSEISITHIRGAERATRAVSINEDIVKKNK